MRAFKPGANLRLTAAAFLPCLLALSVHGQAGGQMRSFVIHGVPKNCTAITQLDSALSSDYQPFFSGWTQKDYDDAVAWSEACSEYGWHVAGRPRLAQLHAQHDRSLGPAAAPATQPPPPLMPLPPLTSIPASAPPTTPLPTARALPPAAPLPMATGTEADFALPGPWPPPKVLGATHELPADGAVVGADATITSHYADTLPDIARRYGFGYEEIVRANPGVDIWLPGEGTRIVLPGRRILPPGVRDGVVVNLAEHRLYYFPKPGRNGKAVVITYPVSIGKAGQDTPLGQSYITAKIKHPTWYPPTSARKEYAERGEALPAAVGPGPDNPLGDFMMRLGFGNGTYEIHGTNKPVAVGMANTYGCIGMYPEDMAALFAMVPVGTSVRFISRPAADLSSDSVPGGGVSVKKPQPVS